MTNPYIEPELVILDCALGGDPNAWIILLWLFLTGIIVNMISNLK